MADSKSNDELSTPVIPDKDAPKTIKSHTDDIDEAANILIAMSSYKETPEKDAEIRTLEHAVAQGAPSAVSDAPAAALIHLDSSFNIAISIEDDEGDEGQTTHASNNTIKASASPTNLMTSDTKNTSGEAQRGIVERVVVSPKRTIFAGRIRDVLSARQKKQPAVQSRQEAETEQDVGHNDPGNVDTQADAIIDVEHAESANTGKLTMATRIADKGKGKALASEQEGDMTNANVKAQHTSSITAEIPKRAVTITDKGKDKAPASEQTNNNLNTIEQRAESASLPGGALPKDETPSAKPFRAPYHGAQTTTAQHFLQTTANPESAGVGAKRAHLNKANELARSIKGPSVQQAEPSAGLDFAVWDESEVIAAHQRIGSQRNHNQSVAPAQAGPSLVANSAPAAPHTTFDGVYIHTAKCDTCDGRNHSVLYRCHSCTNQMCRACMERDPIHPTAGLDWTNHGAQSASKPRVSSGLPRRKKVKVEKPQPKPKPKQRGTAAKAASSRPVDSNARKRVRSDTVRLGSPRNSPAGAAAINARARRYPQDRLAEGSDGADDEDEIKYLGESSPHRPQMRGRNMGMSSLGGRPATGMGGGSALGKRTREPSMFDRMASRDFRPIGASIPYAGSSSFATNVPYAGASNFQPPQRARQYEDEDEDEDEDEEEIFYSVHDHDNRAREAQTERERAAKRHKGPFKRGAVLSKERISEEDEDSEVEDEASKVSKTPQRPKITFRTSSQAQTCTPAWVRPIQNAPAQAPQGTRSASPAGMIRNGNPFLARIDQVRSDYTRVTQEEADLEEQLAQKKAEKAKMEESVSHLISKCVS